MRGATCSSGGTFSPGAVLRHQHVVVIRLDLLLRDADALAEAHLDEAQNLKPIAQIGLDLLLRQTVVRQKRLPSGIRGAVLANAHRQFLA